MVWIISGVLYQVRKVLRIILRFNVFLCPLKSLFPRKGSDSLAAAGAAAVAPGVPRERAALTGKEEIPLRGEVQLFFTVVEIRRRIAVPPCPDFLRRRSVLPLALDDSFHFVIPPCAMRYPALAGLLPRST